MAGNWPPGIVESRTSAVAAKRGFLAASEKEVCMAISKQDALDYHAGGPSRKNRSHSHQALPDSARPEPGLHSRRGGALLGDPEKPS